METYKTINEAVKALKDATGHGYVRYFVNGSEVKAHEWRAATGKMVIYRNGLEVYAEKSSDKE